MQVELPYEGQVGLDMIVVLGQDVSTKRNIFCIINSDYTRTVLNHLTLSCKPIAFQELVLLLHKLPKCILMTLQCT